MCATLFLLFAMLTVGLQASPQTGAIEFIAKATPSGGSDEPVRGMTFYLLSKSFEEIGKEAAITFPLVDMDAFIDKLDVSKELKAWMKKNHCVDLSNDEFIKKLKPEDVMNIPEFYKGYVDRMSTDQTVPFPKPKYSPAEQKKNPEKYAQHKKEYHDAIQAFLIQFPNSTEGIYLSLDDVNPGHKWDMLNSSNTASSIATPSRSPNRNTWSRALTPICKDKARFAELRQAPIGSAHSITTRKPVKRDSAGTFKLRCHREKQPTSRFRI